MTENSAEVGQNLLLGYNSKLSVSDDLQGSVGLSVGALDGAMETALVTPWEKADTKPFHSDVAGRYVTIQYDEGSGSPCLYFGQQSTNGYTYQGRLHIQRLVEEQRMHREVPFHGAYHPEHHNLRQVEPRHGSPVDHQQLHAERPAERLRPGRDADSQ